MHWQQDREFAIPSDAALTRWVQTQRAKSVQQTLRQDRKEKLDQIGFTWKTRVYERHTTKYDKKWKDMYDKLLEFHAEHGHSIVPRGYSDCKLYVWTATQRVLYREERIQENRKQSLEDLGFVWKDDPYDAESSLYQRHWDEMFERLVRFKESHGRTQVKVLQDRELGHWVQAQRHLYKNLLNRIDGPRLTSERKKRLDSIEF
jgi:ABC-type sulfate transport system substrate-binding protein